MLSHDLKNPLTAIAGWRSLLERTAELDSRGERYLRQIGVAVDRMLVMIEQLLYTVTDNQSVALMKNRLISTKLWSGLKGMYLGPL
ncbi:MAG: hypothetical protein M5U34_46435 [Chloroflexi bacterium]|nr:hypothetical protein [Chloroflexota bacterium]